MKHYPPTLPTVGSQDVFIIEINFQKGSSSMFLERDKTTVWSTCNHSIDQKETKKNPKIHNDRGALTNLLM